MLVLAWSSFIAWIILIFVFGSAHGFTGPAFWASQLALLLGLIALVVHLRHRRYSTGEIVLLCLFVLLTVGGLAWVAGIGAHDARQRSLMKRTMADMRQIATAWEAWAEEFHQYNAAGAAAPITIPGDNPRTFPYTFGADALAPKLEPTYVKKFPRTDGWGNPWQFGTDQPFPRGKGAPAEMYVIRSAGGNGRFDPIVPGHMTSYDCDIVYSNGTFISY